MLFLVINPDAIFMSDNNCSLPSQDSNAFHADFDLTGKPSIMNLHAVAPTSNRRQPQLRRPTQSRPRRH